MRQRHLSLVLAVSAATLLAAPALAAGEVPGARAPGFALSTTALGLRLGTPRYGLRLEFEPAQRPSPDALRHEPLSGDLLLAAPGAGSALRFSSPGLSARKGWHAFGALGPLRWAKEFDAGTDLTLRLGARPEGASRQLDFGFRYRF